MAIFGFTTQHIWLLVPLLGYTLGWKLDTMETERMILFRDKSALYGRNPPPATPSWP